jgi:signal transduction histidine kinase
LRFDDSLETVLSADMSTPFGAQSAWRQLVDLISRRRVPPGISAIAKLKAIRAHVPASIRAASARGVAFADPPAALVQLFAEDELAIAAPVLRTARLRADEWIDMLSGMPPAARSILRHRRDLPPAVNRALESFGSVDFVLSAGPVAPLEALPVELGAPVPVEQEAEAIEAEADMASEQAKEVAIDDSISVEAGAAAIESIDWTDVLGPLPANEPDPAISVEAVVSEPVLIEPEVATSEIQAEPAIMAPPELTFFSFASIARGLPVVAEALRHSEAEAEQPPATEAVESPALPEAAGTGEIPEAEEILETVETSELQEAPESEIPGTDAPEAEGLETEQAAEVQEEAQASGSGAEVIEFATLQPPPAEASSGMFQIAELVARIDAYQRQREEAPAAPILPEIQSELFELESIQAQSFRFETDASGIVRWIEGAARAPLIGLSLDLAAVPGGSRVDGAVAGAFRRRAGFANARLVVDGDSDAAGQWRITGIPVFDRESGRFTGYRGTARRPRPDETAEPRPVRSPAADALRQLVHELRTPTNAIAGFAEMIESQMLGPVPHAYRAHAADIRNQAGSLLTAIDDIDMAARIESRALDLRPGEVPLVPLLERVASDLLPLATLRGTTIDIYTGDGNLAIAGDDRAVERLIARLMATLVASGGRGERIGIAATLEADSMVAVVFDRPAALAAYAGDSLLTIDAETEADSEGAPLLGTGFALRLARNLATELRGVLVIGDKALTLRLPAAVIESVEQVSSS